MITRIRGRRSPVPLPGGMVPVLLLTALLASAVSAAAAGKTSFSLGYGTRLIMHGEYGAGFEGALLLDLGKQSGIHVDIDLISQSDAFSSGTGLILDAGVWKAFGSGWSRSVAMFGFSFGEGHPAEADLNGFGMHFGFRQEFWFSKHFGVYGRALLRLWLDTRELDAVSPGIGGGASFRF